MRKCFYCDEEADSFITWKKKFFYSCRQHRIKFFNMSNEEKIATLRKAFKSLRALEKMDNDFEEEIERIRLR